MKKKYIISIILIAIIFTSFNVYYNNVISIQGDNGYIFKSIGSNKYKVIEGSKYIDLICDFSQGGQLVFQDKTFTYEVNGYKGDYTIEIRYPDGVLTKYSDSTHESISTTTEYDSDFLMTAIKALKVTIAPQIIFLHLIAAAIGFVIFIFPKGVFDITLGWFYKKSEPSNFYLIVTRIAGGVWIIYILHQIITTW